LAGLCCTHELSWLHRLLQLQQQGVQQQQQQEEEEDTQGQDAFEVAESLLTLQCSKAIALGFILGPDNTYSTAAAAALQAAPSHPALAAAAAEAAAQGISLESSQDAAGSSCSSLLHTAAEARYGHP
jgi:hypothetical protein